MIRNVERVLVGSSVMTMSKQGFFRSFLNLGISGVVPNRSTRIVKEVDRDFFRRCVVLCQNKSDSAQKEDCHAASKPSILTSHGWHNPSSVLRWPTGALNVGVHHLLL